MVLNVCGIGSEGVEKSDGNTKVQAAMVCFYTMEGHQHECSHIVFPAVSIILESILALLEPIMNKDYNKLVSDFNVHSFPSELFYITKHTV